MVYMGVYFLYVAHMYTFMSSHLFSWSLIVSLCWVMWLLPIGCCYYAGGASSCCLVFGALKKNRWLKHVDFLNDCPFNGLVTIVKLYSTFPSLFDIFYTNITAFHLEEGYLHFMTIHPIIVLTAPFFIFCQAKSDFKKFKFFIHCKTETLTINWIIITHLLKSISLFVFLKIMIFKYFLWSWSQELYVQRYMSLHLCVVSCGPYSLPHTVNVI